MLFQIQILGVMNKKTILGILLFLFASALFSACNVNEQCPAYAQDNIQEVTDEQRV